MSTGQPYLEITFEGGDHTRVDLNLYFDPPLISNIPKIPFPLIIDDEHQVINDHIDLVVLVSAGNHTNETHHALEVIPSHTLIIENIVVHEDPLILNEPIYINDDIDPLEG